MGSRSIAQQTHRRRKRRQRVNQGLCRECGKVREQPDEMCCDSCREKLCKLSMIRYRRLKAQGKCVVCAADVDRNINKCSKCVKKQDQQRKARHKKAFEQGICDICNRVKEESRFRRCLRCRKVVRANVNARHAYLRDEIFNAYGGHVCHCCGETEPLFLEIDHVQNNGNEMKKIHGVGTQFYRWLKVNNYPDGFQILCSNCNHGKHHNGGTCPHLAA